VVGATVFHSLVEVARLQRGESVLIHSASGATGQLAIQLSQHLRCEVFVTVGFEGKKDLLMERYNIPEDHIFYSRDTIFASGIMRKTKNRGMDVVLNSLSSDALTATWEVVAPYGRFIELGRVDIFANSKLPMPPFAKDISFSEVAIDDLIRERPHIVHNIILKVVDLVERGVLESAYPLHVMPSPNFKKA
jgi:NADPH:quinone reductase-like Zn-dependent oxidoreductase